MAAAFLAALAYAAIAYTIIRGLVASAQLRTNRLGVATALIFVTAAGYFALEGYHLLGPSLGIDKQHGLALRDGTDWHMAVWGLLTAAAGIYYVALRRSSASAPQGAQMFEDLKARERQALEINDNIVQGLTVAKYAMSIGAEDHGRQAIDDTLVRARAIITDRLGEPGSEIELGPGDLRRATPAAVVEKKGPPAE
jgi:hypothetical protein